MIAFIQTDHLAFEGCGEPLLRFLRIRKKNHQRAEPRAEHGIEKVTPFEESFSEFSH
jgi:hypothetical protein